MPFVQKDHIFYRDTSFVITAQICKSTLSGETNTNGELLDHESRKLKSINQVLNK